MMDKFTDQLKNIEIEPKSTSWLKLENKLQENNVIQEKSKNYKLLWSSIAASVILLIGASFFFTQNSNQNLDALDGFVVEDMDQVNSLVDGIYNISQLHNLSLAYSKHIIESKSQ